MSALSLSPDDPQLMQKSAGVKRKRNEAGASSSQANEGTSQPVPTIQQLQVKRKFEQRARAIAGPNDLLQLICSGQGDDVLLPLGELALDCAEEGKCLARESETVHKLAIAMGGYFAIQAVLLHVQLNPLFQEVFRCVCDNEALTQFLEYAGRRLHEHILGTTDQRAGESGKTRRIPNGVVMTHDAMLYCLQFCYGRPKRLLRAH